MNYIITAILSIYIFIFSVLSIPFNKVEKAFSQGDAKAIMAMGTSKVLISIEEDKGAYSQSQGAQVLRSFFKKYPPQSFSFNYKGKEEGTSSFAVGKYHSTKNFRISIKFKKKEEQHLIESITIVLFS